MGKKSTKKHEKSTKKKAQKKPQTLLKSTQYK